MARRTSLQHSFRQVPRRIHLRYLNALVGRRQEREKGMDMSITIMVGIMSFYTS
jgi:hypothetical protein